MPASTTRTPNGTTKTRNSTKAEQLAEIITSDFGGKAKFTDLAASKTVQNAFPCKGLLYRHLHGIVTDDTRHGRNMFERTAPGEVKVKARRSR
jgi:hypothetical protein